MNDLSDIARGMVAPGKGLLAADESMKSADKRLIEYGIKTSEEMRRKYRELFLNTPGIEGYLSGVILNEETLPQHADAEAGTKGKNAKEGPLFTQLLSKKGIIPGIKVDAGTEPFPDSADETITNGLIGLPERLAAFKKDYGTGFTKWRAVIRIEGDALPTSRAIVENMKRLATYACEVQRAGMVPILEPEVLLDGAHSRLRSREVLEKTLASLFHEITEQCADPSAIILKTAMAISGNKSNHLDTPEEVAEATLGALMAHVPAEVPGIVFLSGGQTPDQAIDNLRAICMKARELDAPWPLTFSYARALQHDALVAWAGKDENMPIAREAFLARLRQVSEAVKA